MYPTQGLARASTLQHMIKSWWKVAWQKARKILPGRASFLFREWTQQRKNQASSKKATIFPVIPEVPRRKQQLVEKKDADNVRKVLCKSFIKWFRELNLCCYKYRVGCFGSLRLFFGCFRLRLGKHQDSWENKTNCFPRDLTLSVYCMCRVDPNGEPNANQPTHLLLLP